MDNKNLNELGIDANKVDSINKILAQPEFAEQIKGIKSRSELKEIFEKNGVLLTEDQVKNLVNIICKQIESITESDLQAISGGASSVEKGVKDIAKGVGKGIGKTLGGVVGVVEGTAKGAGSLIYYGTKGIGQITYGTLNIPYCLIKQVGKGVWSGLIK